MKITVRGKEFNVNVKKRDFEYAAVAEDVTALFKNRKYFKIHVYLGKRLFFKPKDLVTWINVQYSVDDTGEIKLLEARMSFWYDTFYMTKAYYENDAMVALNDKEKEFIKELIRENL